MGKVNLLEQWYEHGKLLSSHLLLRPRLNREVVLTIYVKLLSSFGRDYFIITERQLKPIENINWLFGLLSAKDNRDCVAALYDIVTLIEYLECLPPGFQRDFDDLKRNPINLRSFFFELYTYRVLDNHNVRNIKKPMIGLQPVEGICDVKGKQFLFECRKAFVPGILKLDVTRRILTEFYLFAERLSLPRTCICTITYKSPVKASHVDHYGKLIRGLRYFFRELGLHEQCEYRIEDDFGVLELAEYDPNLFKSIMTNRSYDALFYIEPANDKSGLVGHMMGRFEVPEESVKKKIRDVLREKKKQHENSSYGNKIIFIDSETLPEFHMGLFQHANMFELSHCREAYNQLNMDSIVCLTRRTYRNGTAICKSDVLYPERLTEEALFIQRIFHQP